MAIWVDIMTARILCIGGPLDKQTVQDDGRVQFGAVDLEAPVNLRIVVRGAVETLEPPPKPPIVTYTRRWISCDGEPAINFYTAEGIGEYAAIVRVFTAYAKPVPTVAEKRK